MKGTRAPLTNSENRISRSTLFLIGQQTNSKMPNSRTEERFPPGGIVEEFQMPPGVLVSKKF